MDYTVRKYIIECTHLKMKKAQSHEKLRFFLYPYMRTYYAANAVIAKDNVKSTAITIFTTFNSLILPLNILANG